MNQLSKLLLVSSAFCLLLAGLVGGPVVLAQSSAAQVSIVSGAATLGSRAFSPDVITVVIGVNNTVVWKNNDNVVHTATGTNFTGFNTGNIQPGASASYTFNAAGTYPYHCLIHPTMTGTVIVKGSTASAASGGGGVPEFPVQLVAATLLVVAILSSYLVVRSRGRLGGPNPKSI